LVLTYPRRLQLAFVHAPLVVIDSQFSLEGIDPSSHTLAAQLQAVLAENCDETVQVLAAVFGWPES
jgi:hypothetical protein